MADPERGALLSKLRERAAAIETSLLFFGLEWAGAEDDAAEAALADPASEHYRHWLASVRRYRPYLLSEPEEKIVTEKSVSGVGAWSRLYSELLSSLRVTLDGEEISTETALARLYRPEREIRQEVAAAVGTALVPGLRTRAYVYNTILLDKSIEDRLRSYPSWISSRNLSNEASDEAVQALVDAVVSRYDVPQRYYRLKARLLGLDRIEHYDRFAPVAESGGAGAGRTRDASSSRRTPTSTAASARSSTASSRRAGSTRPCGRTRRTARSAPRPSPACTRTS